MDGDVLRPRRPCFWFQKSEPSEEIPNVAVGQF